MSARSRVRRAVRDLVYSVPVIGGQVRVRRTRAQRSSISSKARFAPYLPPDPVIVEAGAYNGADTFEFARQWPLGRVHAFEPVPNLYDDLLHATSGCANVSCYPYALAATSGTAVFHVSSGGSDGSSSLLHPTGHLVDHPEVKFEKEIRVETVNLDSWIGADPRRRPDFLWLDLQGAELGVLRSSPIALAAARLVYCEVSLHESYEGGALYADLRTFMEAEGFAVASEELLWADGGNVLFARTRALRPVEDT